MGSFRKEKTVIAFAYILSFSLLFKFVPKDKIRFAIVPFLFKQVITFFFGLLVVEAKLITYPYRPFFKRSYKASFDFEYFVYPVFCALFNLYYPEKANKWHKIIYNIIHPAIITVLEVMIAKYTKLIRYVKWSWHWSFITMWFTNYLSHLFCKWFFKSSSIKS